MEKTAFLLVLVKFVNCDTLLVCNDFDKNNVRFVAQSEQFQSPSKIVLRLFINKFVPFTFTSKHIQTVPESILFYAEFYKFK